jgi:molybdopterin converting factor small subunit
MSRTGAGAAAVRVRIPEPLRARCAGRSELALSGASVRAVLAQIERHHPALYQGICDETGALRPHVGVFVNADHVRDRQGLDTALAGGDVVHILPAVSGG